MTVVATIEVGIGRSLSLPRAEVMAIAVGGAVAVAVGPVASVQQVRISGSLGLSLSFPLAVVDPVAETVVAVVAKSVAVAVQVGLSLSLGLSLSFPLAVVDPGAKTVV